MRAPEIPTPQADSQPALVLDRARIREIFMAHGFTVKEGQTDLKQYVYDAADALLRAGRAPADSVTAPAYSIDADPQGIRARVADAITGALAFGAQGANPPPTGHWLVPFWETAREEASRNRPVSSDTLYLLRRLLSNQHTLTGSEFREELTKIVGEATQAADSVLEDAARLDWLDQQCEAYGFQDIHEGNRWEISGPYANVRVAIDAERAARKQGE